PSICQQIGLKWSLFIGGSFIIFVPLSLMSPAYYFENNQDKLNFLLNRNLVIGILYLGNIIVGFGAAILWVA
ncbi:MAG: hypothetical protein ACK55Z_21440, partial [bacterium]